MQRWNYHLVMTNSSPWKIPTINGGWCRWENHLQMGHLYHGYVSHNQRLFFFKRPFLETRRLKKTDAARVPTRSNSQVRSGTPSSDSDSGSSWRPLALQIGEEHSRHVFMDIHMYYIVTYKQMNVYNYINCIYIHTHTFWHPLVDQNCAMLNQTRRNAAKVWMFWGVIPQLDLIHKWNRRELGAEVCKPQRRGMLLHPWLCCWN